MKKFINSPARYVDEMMAGILAAHADEITCVEGNPRCYLTRRTALHKVAIMTGGGSGHLPLFLGYVGEGMLDGCAVGEVFQSPSAQDILQVTRAVDRGMGVLYIIGNYAEDVKNFSTAAELAGQEGILVEMIRATDDVASAPRFEMDKRRGVAGMFYVYKAAGAMANRGARLDEVLRVARKANQCVHTMGVGSGACILPETGAAPLEMAADEVELGMGIRGESGIRREKLRPVNSIVDEIMQVLLHDAGAGAGDELAVLVNGFGATPKEELYIAYNRVAHVLRQGEMSPWMTLVGEFATSMEMGGFSISILRLDRELKQLLSDGACTPFFSQFARVQEE